MAEGADTAAFAFDFGTGGEAAGDTGVIFAGETVAKAGLLVFLAAALAGFAAFCSALCCSVLAATRRFPAVCLTGASGTFNVLICWPTFFSGVFDFFSGARRVTIAALGVGEVLLRAVFVKADRLGPLGVSPPDRGFAIFKRWCCVDFTMAIPRVLSHNSAQFCGLSSERGTI